MKKLLSVLVLLPALAVSQSTVKVVFPSRAPRTVWAARSPADVPPSSPAVQDSSVTIEHIPAGGVVCVLDQSTGNLAVHSGKEAVWTVAQRDFSRVGQLKVRLEEAGRPVSYASATIGDQTKLIDPQSKGEATFYGVPLGSIRLTVSYKEGGNDMAAAQRFGLDADRTDKVPTLVMVLSSASTGGTGSGGAAESQGKPSGKPEVPSGSLFGQIVLILLVGGGAVAGLIFGLKWLYSNQDKAKDTLGKIGVQVPDPVSPDPTPSTPPAPIAPEPVAPIVLPDAGPIVQPVQAPLSVGEPRLVGTSGSYELSEGVHIVGREPGLTIPLVGESTVSRRHAEMVRQGDSIVLRDLGSTNGTFVNGMQLTADHDLKRGDTVQFGSVQFKVE